MIYYWAIILILFLALWIFLGGRKYEFIGLKPLFSSQPLPQDPLALNPFFINHLKGKFDDNTTQAQQKQITYIPEETCSINENVENNTHFEQRKIENKEFHHHQNHPSRTKWKYQSLCCKALEEIFNKPFTSVRPSWLRNPETNGTLEIDCYNDELKIGVEYNGMQHYVYPNIYHKTQEEFIKLIRRDQYKHNKCDENGVYLITVPYNVPQNKIKQYIISFLPENIFNQNNTKEQELKEEITHISNNIPITTYKEYLA
jgi:hypothetical protein